MGPPGEEEGASPGMLGPPNPTQLSFGLHMRQVAQAPRGCNLGGWSMHHDCFPWTDSWLLTVTGGDLSPLTSCFQPDPGCASSFSLWPEEGEAQKEEE